MKKKIALITGITGQDGSLLAKFLINKPNAKLYLHYGDLTDFSSILNIINQIKPDEIYNLAAQSHVKVSFETPEYTANADALGTLRILEAIKILDQKKKN